MKLFNKTIDKQLFKQYALGSDLSKQEVVAKIFNPQGAQSWFILNSDPEDPDYLWAIVDLGYGAEIGSVSRNELESYRGRFGLGFERDLSFDPINAEELYNGLRQGKYYADGGEVSFIDYKDCEIMYEPHYNKYYANDVEFDSLKEAQEFIDSGEIDPSIRDAYSKGMFADGGLITEDKLKQEEWFSPDMKIMYQYRNGRLGITLFYGKDRRYSKKTVINNASELSMKELNSEVKKEISELKKFAKEMLENNFADGGDIENFSDNQRMIMNQNVELEHHHEELEDILEDEIPVPAWVVAKMATATNSVSDVTHYLDGQKELMEDENEDEDEDEDENEDQEAIENKEVVEPINVSAGTKAELTKKFTDDAWGNLKGFLKGMEGIDLRDDYTFDYKNEQFEVEPIINSDENGVSNAVFTIFDGDGEEVGEVAYSREGGKQKFTANSDYFQWNDAKFEDGGFMNNVYADGGYLYPQPKEMSQYEFLKKIPEQDFKESQDSKFIVYGERKHNDGKHISYLVSKNGKMSISTFKGDKEVYNDSGTVALRDLESAKKSFLNTKFEDGGFMNNVYADGGYFDGTIPKVSTYMSNYADGGQVEYEIEYRDSDGDEYSESFKTLEEANAEISKLQKAGFKITDKMKHKVIDGHGTFIGRFEDGGFMNGAYAKGGKVDSFIPNVGTIDTFMLKSMLIKNPDVKSILSDKEFEFLKNENTDAIGVNNKPFNTIITDGNQEIEFDLKKNVVVKHLTEARDKIKSHYSTNYAKGGEVAKAEILGFSRNVMGTTDIEMKITGMRKPQDFIVYPIGKDDAGNVITIQSDTRIGQINLVKGVGVMSQSHSNGAYFVHLQMDKLTSFTISESDLKDIKAHVFKTAGANVGTRGIVTDNSGASGVYAIGGAFNSKRMGDYIGKHFIWRNYIYYIVAFKKYENRVANPYNRDKKTTGSLKGSHFNPHFTIFQIELKDSLPVYDSKQRIVDFSVQHWDVEDMFDYINNKRKIKISNEKLPSKVQEFLDSKKELIYIHKKAKYQSGGFMNDVYADGGYNQNETFVLVKPFIDSNEPNGWRFSYASKQPNGYVYFPNRGIEKEPALFLKEEAQKVVDFKNREERGIPAIILPFEKKAEISDFKNLQPRDDSYEYNPFSENDNKSDSSTLSDYYAKGGITYYKNENERLSRPKSDMEEKVFEKVKNQINSELFIGNFGWRTDNRKQANIAYGYLYSLDDFDKNLIKNLKLKQGEEVFRYVTRVTAISGTMPFIKINIEKALLYFPMLNDSDDIVFETRGVTPLWISLIEGSFADGGGIEDDYKGTIINDSISYIVKKLPYNYQIEDNSLGLSVYGQKEALISLKNLLHFKYGIDSEFYGVDTMGLKELKIPSGQMVDSYAKGGMVVTSVKDIPNFTERLEQGKITYRGLGMGKLYDAFYDLAGTSGTRIKVDGKEYYITDKEFDTFSRGADGKMRVSFDAPARRHEDGGFMNDVYADGGDITVLPFYLLKKEMSNEEQENVDIIHDAILIDNYKNLPKGYSLKPLKSYRESGMNSLIVEVTPPKGNKFNLRVHTYELRDIEKEIEETKEALLPEKKPTNLDINTLYDDYYVKGYENKAYQFAYVPEFSGKESIVAYGLGLEDGGKKKKKDYESFEKAMSKVNSVKKDWWHTVVNPNEDFNNFDDKMPIDWDVDDFKSWVVSESDLDGNVDKAVLDIVKMPQSKLLVEYLNKNGSGKNNNEFYKEFGNWQSALYDIFTQMKKDYLFKKSLKYVLKADIKTVTVKTKNGKEVTYSGADVLNGNYVLAKGGDITSKAKYFGKNDVVEVELKDGTTVKPVNGYWVKKGAEPIGAEPTPTSSGKSESKFSETFTKKGIWGWDATTNVNDFNNYDWRITTFRGSSGKLISSAKGGKYEKGNGYNTFKYTMYDDPYHTLEVSQPSRLTEKVVTEQHDKALAKFKKFMETGMFKGGGKISNFDKLSDKVAKEYEGKPVKSQYQEEYGKYYSKEEAQEVGDKVAGKVKAMQTDSKAFGGLFSSAKSMVSPKKYPELEGKQVALKTGKFVQVFTQAGSTLSVLELGKVGSGERPYSIDISEVDLTSYEAGGQTSNKKVNSSVETLKKANILAKEIRKDGESWLDAKKRAFAQLKK